MPQTLAAAIVLLAFLAGPARAQEPRMVPVTVDGERVRLEMRLYLPTTAGPAPTLVFNHGSTGRGTHPEVFTRPLDFPEVAPAILSCPSPARIGRSATSRRRWMRSSPCRSATEAAW
jgi:hypothetical protein